MSIAINDNPQRDQITAAGAQTVFTYSFPISDEEFITVYQRGANETPNDPAQVLALGADYSVQGVGQEAGGTITLNVGATAGDIITLVGTEPIDRMSVFDDLNPLTVALNQQLNDLTIMVNQVFTYWNSITPHYNYDELISAPLDDFNDGVRPFKRILPMLPNGHVWVGRGEIGQVPDDIITAPFGTGNGNVVSSGDPMRKSIATWTGTGTIITDSYIDIDATMFIKTADTVQDRVGFDDEWGAMHWPAHVTADRPAVPQDGDTYYDNTLEQYYGYINGVWSPFAMGTGDSSLFKQIFTQVGHGFVQGDYVYMKTDGDFALTNATTVVTAELQGLVSRVIDADNFELQTAGFVDFGSWVAPPTWWQGINPGEVFFISDTNSGQHTLVPPTTNGYVNLPVFWAINATLGQLRHSRGIIVGAQPPTGGEAGTPNTVIITVTQPGHGFSQGDWLYCDAYNAGAGHVVYARGDSSALATSHVAGVVYDVIDVDTFRLQEGGYNNNGAVTTATNAPGSAIASGGVYYLSNTDPGKLMNAPPVTVGHYSVRCYEAEQTSADDPPDSIDAGYILDKRPIIISAPSGSGAWQLIHSEPILDQDEIYLSGILDGTYQDIRVSIRGVTCEKLTPSGGDAWQYPVDFWLQYELGGVLKTDTNYVIGPPSVPAYAYGPLKNWANMGGYLAGTAVSALAGVIAGANANTIAGSSSADGKYTICFDYDFLDANGTGAKTNYNYQQGFSFPIRLGVVKCEGYATASSAIISANNGGCYIGSTDILTGFKFFLEPYFYPGYTFIFRTGTISVYGRLA